MQEEKIIFRERIGFATAKYDNVKGFPKGEQKEVIVAKMSTGRLAIYKDLNHYSEDSGYKTYDMIEDLEKDFHVEKIQRRVN